MKIPNILKENKERMEEVQRIHKRLKSEHNELIEYINKNLPNGFRLDCRYGSSTAKLTHRDVKDIFISIEPYYIKTELTPDNIHKVFQPFMDYLLKGDIDG